MKLNIEQKRYDTEIIKNIKTGNVFKDPATNNYCMKTDVVDDNAIPDIVCIDIRNGKLIRYDNNTVVKPVKAEVKIEEYDA